MGFHWASPEFAAMASAIAENAIRMDTSKRQRDFKLGRIGKLCGSKGVVRWCGLVQLSPSGNVIDHSKRPFCGKTFQVELCGLNGDE